MYVCCKVSSDRKQSVLIQYYYYIYFLNTRHASWKLWAIIYSLTASDVFLVIIALKAIFSGGKGGKYIYIYIYIASNICFHVLYSFCPKLFLVQEEFSEIFS